MKKLCILLCITVVMMSVSVVVLACDENETAPITSLSAPHPVIAPAEKDAVSDMAVMYEFFIVRGYSTAVSYEREVAADKYTPEIMEQINIISVAPRE